MLWSKVPLFCLLKSSTLPSKLCPSTTVVNFLPSELSVVQQSPTFFWRAPHCPAKFLSQYHSCKLSTFRAQRCPAKSHIFWTAPLLAAKLGSWYATAAVQVLDSQRTLGRDKILLQYECWIDREHRGGIKFYCSMSAGLTENTGEG